MILTLLQAGDSSEAKQCFERPMSLLTSGEGQKKCVLGEKGELGRADPVFYFSYVTEVRLQGVVGG